MGTPVAVALRSSTLVMLKNIAIEKVQPVTKPMATVPMIATGIIFSGWWISSDRWVAQSKQANAQLVLISPTMNAKRKDQHTSFICPQWSVPMPFWDQPVLLTKLANTNFAC